MESLYYHVKYYTDLQIVVPFSSHRVLTLAYFLLCPANEAIYY